MPSVATVKEASRVDYESLATRHFIFNKGNSTNLTCLKTGNTLTVASSAPTHNSKTLTLGSSNPSALHTGIADSLTWSAWGIVKVPATGLGSGFGQTLFSTYGGTADGGIFAGINSGTSGEMTGRAVISGGVTQLTWNAENLTVGAWIFVGFVVDHSGSTKFRRYVINQFAYDVVDSAAFTPSPTYKIGIGTASASTQGANSSEWAEFGMVDGAALTKTQFKEIYHRSRSRAYRLNDITIGY